MLQPRNSVLFLILFILVDCFKGQQYNINHTPRIKQNDQDVTTVLLVDSRGRSPTGKFLNIKPDLGLIASTARTFIQEGVTTEYATQILGTTLDNGRLYAHLLTKSSRVLYDDSPTKTHDQIHSKWTINENFINVRPSLENINNIIPSNSKDFLLYTTRLSNDSDGETNSLLEVKSVEEEILKESPSNNYRVPFVDLKKNTFQSNVKVFKISPEVTDVNHENIIIDEELNDEQRKRNSFSPSKIKEWENLPTFTVRNEFSPSGLSFLGDLPDFEERTERSKLTTPADRRAKLLFKAHLTKPNAKDLTSITYTGFADFTTTVGDTVIVFSPHTTEKVEKSMKTTNLQNPTISSMIQQTTTLLEPPLATKVTTFLSQEPPMETKTFKASDLEMKTAIPTMVIDKTDRLRDPKKQTIEEHIDIDAKSAVLAHEQGQDTTQLHSLDVIQPSETQIPMLSTPSEEDIAKIFASLQALQKQSTQGLETVASSIIETSIEESRVQPTGGATTIFFDDEIPTESNSVSDTYSSIRKEEATITTESANMDDEESNEESLETTENINIDAENEAIIIENKVDATCSDSSKIVATTTFKTLTYLTTFFIPDGEGTTSISVKANEVTSTEIGFTTEPCIGIVPSSTTSLSIESSITEEIPTTTEEVSTIEEQVTTEEQATTEDEMESSTEQEITTIKQIESTTAEITTEEHHVTDAVTEAVETTTEEDGDELEIIYKTLYTTYTYLTTYFQESTSSISSRTVVTTNVVTSTLDPKEGLVGLENEQNSGIKQNTISFEDLADITPSKTTLVESTDSPTIHVSNLNGATPLLDDKEINLEAIKTYYTTYTYFTTIFVDGETEISSRTEVYTNYITPSVLATVPLNTRLTNPIENDNDDDDDDLQEEEDDDDYINKKKKLVTSNIKPQNIYNTIDRKKTTIAVEDVTTTEDNQLDNVLDLSDYETISTMVTDVRSTTSEGERKIIDNLDKRNVLLDDQIVSESNNDSEIIPSPTLLLQTSYTTFTYFTTMYHGTTSSNVVSRLETVTNVVTQTLEPTPILSTEDPNSPITYFTTFTYWTTLYKDGTTKITSREETVTNVETPTIKATSTIPVIITTDVIDSKSIITESDSSSLPSTIGEDALTTYYTTYTYYTTSYIGDSTILNSRLETVTNIINNTDIDTNYIGKAIGLYDKNKIVSEDKPIEDQSTTSTYIKPTGLLSTILNTIENDGTTTILSTDVYGTYIDGLYAKVLESTSSILTKEIKSSPIEDTLKPTGIVSINQGKIVDAEGISTLFYTTQAIGTYIDNLYAQVIESTSSLTVNEAKKSALPNDFPLIHKTGLVRSIEGSIIQNDTTTFYESKVLGTNIDGRYAQIIESTSSFLIGKPSNIQTSTIDGIQPSSTQAPDNTISPTAIVTPSSVSIEGSINESAKVDEEITTEENDEVEDDHKGKGSSRLTFQTKKRTFTPAIRPFAPRPRPSFAPKRKQSGQTTAATITRSDFTPTVTAVPASKLNRFGGRRSSTGTNAINPTVSSSRKFSRSKTSSSPSFGGRRSSSSRIQPTSTFGFSSRRSSSRSSSGGSNRSSSLFGTRPRIRPTLTSGLNRSPSSNVISSTDDENNITISITENPEETVETGETTLEAQTTTEITSRRGQNPLLKFRRPPLGRTTTTRNSKAIKNVPKSTTSTTTTSKPKTTRSNSLLNRSRANGLFPRRNLFTTTSTTPPPDEEEELVDEDLLEEYDTEEDTDYESSIKNTQIAEPPTTPKTTTSNRVQIKPFKKRTKRETYSRFRRPISKTTSTAAPIEKEETRGKYTSRSRTKTSTSTTTTTPPTTPSTRKRISPSKAQSRTQFTLRGESEKRSNFKRPTSSNRVNRLTTTRPSNKRYRNNYQTEATRKNNNSNRQTTRTTSRSRTNNQRQRYPNDVEIDTYVQPKNDGTITVTRHVPTEVTIPVVNGKITEYKNVVTAKVSTDILGPSQYTTSVNALGKDVTILLSENTDISSNGATLITQYVLKETPTTSIIFTPTYINRRKTSFRHVIPSTIYEVEQVVNTIQPALAAQAPLANILLSQLLLGGLQPQPNALLGFQQPLTPTTEIKTRTTTYVTTVTSEISTVIPLTFRGKEIFTTLIDSSVSVVTATEFLTDTIVVTPSFGYPQQQLNTALLLPLLQQQLQQQQQLQNNLHPVQPTTNFLNVNDQPTSDTFQEEEKLNLADDEFSDIKKPLIVDDIESNSKSKTSRKGKKHKPSRNIPLKESSVITLYVSGRTPGEFTTILSTVPVTEEKNRKRRELRTLVASPSQIIKQSNIEDKFDNFLMAGVKDIELETSEITRETQSLESIVGDVSTYLTTLKSPDSSQSSKYIKSSRNSHDFLV
ncbi:mucin-2 [Diorhabda sublineata]|uniref:mucin-2 n=1 Tax=Diorhabda sublineata TaxID=1163346 RepID=UPI0024E046F9|nr:mucin-2 [Diorhabda sublineata]